MTQVQNTRPVGVIVLAAGQGKRMKSSIPKVLHEIAGNSLLAHVLNSVKKVLPKAPIAIVVGHEKEKVEQSIRNNAALQKLNLTFVHQIQQNGTGDAVRCVMNSQWGDDRASEKAELLVLPGDLPLITPALVQEMSVSLKRGEALRLLTCELPDPTGYGRVIRRGKLGSVLRIVEEKDASSKEKQIREVAAAIYSFQSEYLVKGLGKLTTQNAQNEYYLTDLVEIASKSKRKISVLTWKDPEDLRGVNDPWELSIAHHLMNKRIIRDWAVRGVRFIDPRSNQIDVTVELKEGTVVHPGAILTGRTFVDEHSIIGPYVVLKDMKVGKQVNIKVGSVGEGSSIDSCSQIGPYAHLRPESSVGAHVKIGNFVELKKTRVGDHSSIAHLSYLGDAEVGKNVNIGCGFITCNFDGRVIQGQRKHRTVIEDDVFLGSDCQTVAPVKIGKGAFIASGSTITEEVMPGDLAIARSRQVNKPGYAQKLKTKQELLEE